MAEFSRLVITNKGQALLAKMMTGEGNVEFTKISASDMEYTLEQLEELTELSGVKQTVSVAKVTRTNGVAVTIEATFDNTELTQGYHMRALGLYAIDPDDGEILYAVTAEVSGCCYMPAYNRVTVSGACIKLVTTVGNAENVSLEVDPGVYATVGEIKELRESVDGIETWKDSTQKRLDNWGPTITGHGQVINSLRDSIGNLKPVATSGDYNDLSNRPSIPAAVRVKGNAESSYRTGDVNLTAENIGAVNKSGDTITGNLHLNYDLTVMGNLNGQKDSTAHSIILGHNQKDYCDFYEYGGIFNFYKGNKFNNKLLGSITNNGWEGNVYTEDYLYLTAGNGCVAKVSPALDIRTLACMNGEKLNLLIGRDYDDTDLYGIILDKDTDFIRFIAQAGHLDPDVPEGYVGTAFKNQEILLDPPYGIYPGGDGSHNLGLSNKKWAAVYASSGTIQTSDRNAKNMIEELSDEKAKNFIYRIKPSTYKMNDGTSGRTHWGIISQDIEELFEELNMTSLDFAGFIKSPKIKEIRTMLDDNGKKKKVFDFIEGEYDYSLRYDEFIAPIIKVIQSQHEEIETLKQETQMLKQQMQQLMNKES